MISCPDPTHEGRSFLDDQLCCGDCGRRFAFVDEAVWTIDGRPTVAYEDEPRPDGARALYSLRPVEDPGLVRHPVIVVAEVLSELSRSRWRRARSPLFFVPAAAKIVAALTREGHRSGA